MSLDLSACMFIDISRRRFTLLFFFFFQAEDGIRDLVRSRGLGDVYKRQDQGEASSVETVWVTINRSNGTYKISVKYPAVKATSKRCLLYTSDAADERSSVDLGGRRIIKKKKKEEIA